MPAGIVARHYGKLVFIDDSITRGGNGDHPGYRYQVFKRLAEKGVPNASGEAWVSDRIAASSGVTVPE